MHSAAHSLNRVQYPADRDVLKVTWFYKTSTQGPKSFCGQSLSATENVWDRFRCLFTSITLGTLWRCPVNNVVIIPSWFVLKLSNSPAFFSRGFLRKPLAYVCPWMDCQYSSCFLLIQSLITPMATLADMPRVGWGAISGCEEPCLANWSSISCPSIPMCPCTLTS